MVYKSLNRLAPNNIIFFLNLPIVQCSNVSSYSLRDTNDNLIIALPHTNFMKNSFSYSGAVLWSSLPIELRQAANNTSKNLSTRHLSKAGSES